MKRSGTPGTEPSPFRSSPEWGGGEIEERREWPTIPSTPFGVCRKRGALVSGGSTPLSGVSPPSTSPCPLWGKKQNPSPLKVRLFLCLAQKFTMNQVKREKWHGGAAMHLRRVAPRSKPGVGVRKSRDCFVAARPLLAMTEGRRTVSAKIPEEPSFCCRKPRELRKAIFWIGWGKGWGAAKVYLSDFRTLHRLTARATLLFATPSKRS